MKLTGAIAIEDVRDRTEDRRDRRYLPEPTS
jgi:hypothetical protein